MTAPGWFPDPSDPSRQRYFDGTAWTENYAPRSYPASAGYPATPTPVTGQSAVQPTKPGMSNGVKILLGSGAAVLALAALGSITDSGKTKPSTSSSGSARSESGAVYEAPTTTKSGFTGAQDNAIEKAQSYLNYSAFSRDGLIKQLVFSKFTHADATFAVAYIESTGGVDWNEQAVKKAKSYLDYSAFSLEGLVQQLEFSGFTPAQAQYGANKAYG